MSIRFPDFGVLFHRSADRTGPAHRAGMYPTPELLHAQAAKIREENERRRTTIEQGRESDRATLKRRRERERSGGRQPASKGKGRHVDLEA